MGFKLRRLDPGAIHFFQFVTRNRRNIRMGRHIRDSQSLQANAADNMLPQAVRIRSRTEFQLISELDATRVQQRPKHGKCLGDAVFGYRQRRHIADFL